MAIIKNKWDVKYIQILSASREGATKNIDQKNWSSYKHLLPNFFVKHNECVK